MALKSSSENSISQCHLNQPFKRYFRVCQKLQSKSHVAAGEHMVPFIPELWSDVNILFRVMVAVADTNPRFAVLS
jgi:hypothetical protein